LTAAGALRGVNVKVRDYGKDSTGKSWETTERRLRLFFLDPWYSKEVWDACMFRYGSRATVDEDADLLDF
jgi:hypothetical protein